MSIAAAPAATRPSLSRADAAVAIAALMICTLTWAVLSGGWNESSPVALPIGLAGLAQFTLLARRRVPRLLAIAAVLPLLLATVIPLTINQASPDLTDDAGRLLTSYLGAVAGGLLSNDQWAFVVGLSTLVWLCGAWLAWWSQRERNGAIASGLVWVVVAVTVINAPVSGRLLVPAALTSGLAVLLLSAVQLDRLNSRWTRRRLPVLPGTDGRFGVAAVAVAGVVVLLASVLPPVTSSDISASVFGFGGGGPRAPDAPSTSNDPNGPGAVRFSASTVPGGKLIVDNQQVLTYTTPGSSGSYLQVITDPIFDRGNWFPENGSRNNNLRTEIFSPGVLPRDRLVADGGLGAEQSPISITLVMSRDPSGGAGQVPFPGEPDSAQFAGEAYGLRPPNATAGLLTIDSVAARQNLLARPITVAGTRSTASAEALRQAGSAYPAYLSNAGYLSLPDDVSLGGRAITALARQWTVGATNPYDQAIAIESHLRDPTQFQYTLDPPLPAGPSNQWPVVYFLTSSHKGYCQYYASAMGAMLRALGVPSRLVNGYGPGEAPIQLGFGRAQTQSVTDNDAHTWVQAYFPDYGWIPFEPTPPSTLGDYQPFPRTGAGPAAPSSAPSATPTPAGAAAAAGSGAGHGGFAAPAAALGASIGLAALLVILIPLRFWFRRPRDIRGTWLRLALLGRLVGVPRDPALTFREYADRVSSALPGARGGTPAERGAAVALGEVASLSTGGVFAPRSLSVDDAVRLRHAWQRLADLAPRIVWRVVLRRRTTP